METKGDKGIIILGVVSIIAIVIMILLVKSVATGKAIFGPGQPFTTADSCGEMPNMEPYLHLSVRECVQAGRSQCEELYGGQATPYSPIGFCHDQCNKHVANGCRYAGSILGRQNTDPRNWQGGYS